MKIVCSESLRVTTLGGTAVLFEAGVPREISEEIGLLAIQMGAKEYDEKYIEMENAEDAEFEEVMDEVFKGGLKQDANESQNKLITILEKMMDEGDPKKFRADGYPKAAVVNKAMGETIDSDTREEAWESILNS
jgi:hypothetical protein